MRRRVQLLAVTAATLLLVSTGCTDDEPKPSPSGPVAWQDCYDRIRDAGFRIPGATVECGTVTVPKDWDDPGNGETPNPEEDVIDAEVVDDEDDKK